MTDRAGMPERGSASRLHDMRNALAPALLLAERLEVHPDPKVAEIAKRISASIELAVRVGRGEPP